MDDSPHPCHPRRQTSLEPHTAVGVNDVWFDAGDLARKRAWPKHGPARHRLGKMKLSYVSQPLGNAPEVLEREHVAVEPTAVEATHDVGKETLHAAVVQILNDVEDSGAARRRMARVHAAQITPRAASVESTPNHRQIPRSMGAVSRVREGIRGSRNLEEG